MLLSVKFCTGFIVVRKWLCDSVSLLVHWLFRLKLIYHCHLTNMVY